MIPFYYGSGFAKAKSYCSYGSGSVIMTFRGIVSFI